MKANDKPMIEVDRLVRKFGDRTVLNDISFNVHRRRYARYHGRQRLR